MDQTCAKLAALALAAATARSQAPAALSHGRLARTWSTRSPSAPVDVGRPEVVETTTAVFEQRCLLLVEGMTGSEWARLRERFEQLQSTLVRVAALSDEIHTD